MQSQFLKQIETEAEARGEARGVTRARHELLMELVEHLPIADQERLREIEDLEQLKLEIMARLQRDP